jgi:signal transduction histidine kinase
VNPRKLPKAVAGRSRHADAGRGAEARLAAVAGGIAHDLNTVITMIYGYSEMAAEDKNITQETAAYVRNIITAADRAKLLTGQLLDINRQAELERVPVMVAGLLDDVIKFLKPSLPGGVKIRRRIRTGDAWLEVSPLQLFRLFMNILTNSVQALSGRGGTVTVTVDFTPCPEDQLSGGIEGCLLVRFSDTGTGMDERTAALSFRPFNTSGREKGTGLGLTIVGDIMTEMGGRIRVSSSPGAGTAFDLLFPEASFGPLPEKH